MPSLNSRLHDALTGRYAIERELGRGGMATVFLARDLRHDRPVALKVLHPEIAASLGTGRFEREIRLAARLQHPHILSVHDSGEVPGTSGDPPLLWFTMPYVEGESLRDRLNRERQLPFADAVRIAREAADALDHAHHHGVIHRDIKPENILLTGTHALVADFGIARAWAGGDVGVPSREQAVTGTGVSIGTPAYMSPEQATGERDIDARTDIYSLGCVLYEMLVGEPPFTGPTPQAIMSRRLTEEPRPVRATRPAVPEPVEQALRRALARLPVDRFGSAAEFARAFDVPDAYSTPTSLPVRSAPARRRMPLAVVLALGVLIGAGVLFAWRRYQAGSPSADEGSPFLAVLPFENLGDSADAYFADGMTDEVRGKLASVPGFRVIARGSVSQYRSRATPLRQIADDLGVRYLLTGTVRWIKAGGQNRVRVSPELVEIVRGGTEVSRWQQAFDADLTDVFQIQADIAGQVAAALNVRLAPATAPALAEAPTKNLAAYDAFLRGEESYIRSSGPTALEQAILHYERAVALDSSFARAWGRLSQAQSSSYFNTAANRAAAEAARTAAERALALAPQLPEVHLALGNYYSLVRLDYPRAIEAFGRGLALAPEHPELLGAMGLAEQAMGDVEEALQHMRRGLASDPRSLLFVRRLTRLLTLLRRYPEAEETSRRALAIAPGDAAALTYAIMVHLGKGDLAAARGVLRSAPKDRDEAARITYIALDWSSPWLFDDAQRELVLHAPLSFFGNDHGTRSLTLARAYAVHGDLARARVYADSARIEFERLLREVPEHPWTHALLGLSLALLGRRAEAIREGELAVEMLGGDLFQGPYVRSHLVHTYLQLGEHEKAMNLIEVMLRTPSFLSAARLRVDPTFDPLRKHPRFQALLATR